MIGETIAQYRIVEKLGEGGMGVVYKAQDTRLERDVALKFLRPEHVRGEEDSKRFFREARALATLDHPNICTVYDVNEADGRAYIAMAFLKGRDLHEVVKGGALPVEEALDIVRQVATGLQAAHDANVVHRDIKSTNIILTQQGVAKILDFGLARLSDRTTLTAEGMTMGTIAFMSPEQATGGSVDHRTDIWGTGVLLYELLTGALPFHADFDQAVVYLILNQDPKPLSDYRDDVPDEVQDIVDRALAKDAGKRFQSGSELIDAIDALTGGVASTPARAPSATPGVKIDPNLIAVFDFANSSGSSQDDWLSGGIAETLTADIKRVKSLRAVARQPLVQASASLKQVGGEEAVSLGKTFGAGWVVWGDYQRLGDAIKITANFTRVSSGNTADTYTASGPMGDIFKLQQEIVAKLADTVDVKLTTSELQQIEHEETSDEKAYEYYARARHRANRMGINDFDETRALYEKAIELDPGYALAYSGLANLHLFRHIARPDPADLEAGRRLAKRATEIDPDLAEPHIWLGYAHMRSGEFEQSITVGHRAVELEDYNPWANYFYASELLIPRSAAMRGLGDYDSEGMKDGIRHMHRAVELNPSLQPGLMTLCWAYALHGQYDEAMTYVGRAVALEEAAAARGFSFVGGQTVQGHMFRRKGDWSQARLAYERSLEFLEQSQHVYRNSFLAQTWCGLGDVEFARGSYDTALTHYGKVLELTLAEPMQTSNGFSYVRANARMAKAYNLMGVHNLSEKKMQHAVDTLHKREGMSFFWMWDSCDAQVHFDLASAYAELRRNDDAINSLEEAAVRLGFRDLHAIEADANLWALKDDPRMKAIVSTIQSTPPLP